MRKMINHILIFCSFFVVPVVLFSVPEESGKFAYKNIESLKPVQLDLHLQGEAEWAQKSMIPRSKIPLLPSDVKLKKQDDVALKGVSKMPADDLERQIKDEISIRKERAKNIERMKAIVPDRQAGYAADKAKKAAEKKPVLKGSPLSKEVMQADNPVKDESKVEELSSFLPSNETKTQNPISSSSNSAYLQLKKLGTQLQLSVAQFAKRFIGLGSHDTIASLQKSLADISSQMNDVAKAAKYNIDSLQSSDNHLQELFASIMKKKGDLESIVISKKELLGKANGHESSVEELKKLLEESPDPKNLGKNLLETYNKEINNLISSIQEFRNEIVLKMPADDLERQIKDEISIRKERAKNIERMKAIVPDRQAGYAADKAKKDAKKAAYKPDIAFDPEDEYERIDLKSDVLKEHVKKLSDAGDLVRFASRSPDHLEALTKKTDTNKAGIDFEPDIRGVQQGQSRLPYPAAGPGNRANQNRVRKKSPLSKEVVLPADNPVVVQTLDLVAPHATGSYFGDQYLLPEEAARKSYFGHEYLLPEEAARKSYFGDTYEDMDAQEIARQKQDDVALKGVSKMPADDLERQIKDEISIRKERAKNIERMKAIVPDRQAGYAADKAKKAAEKKPVLKGSPLSKGVKPLPAESSKSKEEKVQHAEPSKSKAKENDGLDSLINSTEEYFASISPEDADKMALESFNAMSEEEKQGGF